MKNTCNMVNALFDHSSSGTSGSSSDAIQVSGDVASLSTEEFDIIDTSDSGIVMSVSRICIWNGTINDYGFQQQRGGTSESRQYDSIRGCHDHSVGVQSGIRCKSIHRSEQVAHEYCSKWL